MTPRPARLELDPTAPRITVGSQVLLEARPDQHARVVVHRRKRPAVAELVEGAEHHLPIRRARAIPLAAPAHDVDDVEVLGTAVAVEPLVARAGRALIADQGV